MIESLTPAQEAQLSVYRDKWLAIGLSTDRVDPDAATAAVNLMYKCGGAKPPSEIRFVDGPLAAIKVLKEYGVSDSNAVLNNSVYGCQEAHWLGFYDYFEDVCGIDLGDKIDGLKEVARTCGWVTTYEHLAVVQDRPLLVKFDDEKRLHCEDGPAIKYADGTEVYAWHGVRVPGEWFNNRDSLTPQKALTWENVEQRRAACEILGWVNILAELKSKVIDEDDDPQIGTLLEVNIPDIGKERFLKVKCGTGRTFALPVPPTMKTALEANAWTFDINPDIIANLEIRT